MTPTIAPSIPRALLVTLLGCVSCDGGSKQDVEDDGGRHEPADPDDPNRLDHDRLFQCKPNVVSTTFERLRRLTAPQFEDRWPAQDRVAPYAHSPEHRYSTYHLDSRMDDGTAEQLVDKALVLGRNANVQRLGWPTCMRRDRLASTGGVPSRSCLESFLADWLQRAWQRPATDSEIARHAGYSERMMATHGPEIGLELTAAYAYVDAPFLVRIESADAPLDAQGRRMLGPWQIAESVVMAITDSPLVDHRSAVADRMLRPTIDALRAAAAAGELTTKAQIEAHVRALLDVPLATGDDGQPVLPASIQRFLAEYLGYPEVQFNFKNGGLPRELGTKAWRPREIETGAEATIAQLYADDRDFVRRLLTADTFFVPLNLDPARSGPSQWPYNLEDSPASGWTSMPAGQRAGILTHPAWLAAHSVNQPTDPHPIHRGLWIRRNLLCGALPNLAIEAEAVLPDLPGASVRERLEVTTSEQANPSCWGCHRYTEPLGMPLQSYDHYGRWRSQELVADGSYVEVDPRSTLVATGDPTLDGVEVTDAIHLANLLGNSKRVEECFVRNSFRYFVGRAETYEDACTLVAMRDAYRANEGSLREMLVAVMVSDTFLYRSQQGGM